MERKVTTTFAAFTHARYKKNLGWFSYITVQTKDSFFIYSRR